MNWNTPGLDAWERRDEVPMLKTVKVKFELGDDEAWAMAQFVKRLCWDDVRRCAVDEQETRTMICALALVRAGLADAGYAPR